MSFQRKLDCLWAVVIAMFLVMLMLFGWSLLGNNYDGAITASNNHFIELKDITSEIKLSLIKKIQTQEEEIKYIKESIMPSALKGRK